MATRLRITDLHLGIVWGTRTEETRLDEPLVNRFDYDGDYGAVLNRFLAKSVNGCPLAVHGSGGQTRAFINVRDTVRCVALALHIPRHAGFSAEVHCGAGHAEAIGDDCREAAVDRGSLPS